jgi:hypothetical protein
MLITFLSNTVPAVPDNSLASEDAELLALQQEMAF